jgi:ATP-dependent exoDNAse (exonuclease V) alpha subunit
VRGERATVTAATRETVTVRFDDGRERAMSPRTLLAHLDYGYAGTTHKVQGQTSAIHVASLGPAKDIASMYVSATRGRDRTMFVVDARDYLTDTELVQVQAWEPGQIDDEVLDRVKAALAKRADRIDTPREHMRAPGKAVSYSQSRGRESMHVTL